MTTTYENAMWTALELATTAERAASEATTDAARAAYLDMAKVNRETSRRYWSLLSAELQATPAEGRSRI